MFFHFLADVSRRQNLKFNLRTNAGTTGKNKNRMYIMVTAYAIERNPQKGAKTHRQRIEATGPMAHSLSIIKIPADIEIEFIVIVISLREIIFSLLFCMIKMGNCTSHQNQLVCY